MKALAVVVVELVDVSLVVLVSVKEVNEKVVDVIVDVVVERKVSLMETVVTETVTEVEALKVVVGDVVK